MATADRPMVSVLLPAYNYERFVERALASALAQEYPEDRLEIVVVNDGSTDDTADVVRGVMSRHPGRIKLVEQRNQGQLATIARARAEATGELLAFLDADDEWLPSKVSRQVDLFQAQPNVGVVFCDMTTVDTEGRVLKPTLYEPGEPDMDPVRLYARVLRSNIIYGGSSMYRAELVSELPAEAESWDWWLSVRINESRALGYSEIGFVPEQLALYRQHPDNMLLGASGDKLVALRRRQLRFQLWAFRHMDLGPLGINDLRFVLGGVGWFVHTTLQEAGVGLEGLVTVAQADRARASDRQAQVDQALATGALVAAARLQLQVWACDPLDEAALMRFHELAALADPVLQAPHPLYGARPFVVLVDLEQLLRGDEMLLAYASAMGGLENVTLAIDCTGLPAPEAVPRLEQLLARCELEDREDIDLLAVLEQLDPDQRIQMRDRISARYVRASSSEAGPADSPTFTPDQLPELRALSEAAGVRWGASGAGAEPAGVS